MKDLEYRKLLAHTFCTSRLHAFHYWTVVIIITSVTFVTE